MDFLQEKILMKQLSPVFRDQRTVDADHLRLLAVFHFVVAGLAVAGLGFLLMHYVLMNTFLSDPEMWRAQNQDPPPEAFLALLKWFYLFMGVSLVAGGIANLVSGLFILKRKHRIFSLVVAGINCLWFPFGTALGVCTLLVLLRDTVREVYDA